MYRSIAFAAAFSVVAVTNGGAFAQQQQQRACATRDAALQHLAKKYAEEPVAIGLANNGGVLEVLSSDGGSWTIILTMPSGVACMLATGQSWESVTPTAKTLGSQS